MARKKQEAVETVTRSYLRINLTLDIPVYDGSEVNDIRKELENDNINAVVDNYCYDVDKVSSKVILVEEPIPAIPVKDAGN